jgi:hypothetical protein
MLVFWKARLVLLAVPKTGTTALESAFGPLADMTILNPPRLKHMTLGRYRRQLAPILERDGTRLEVMALMREPVDWLSSWYRYRARPELAGRPQSTAELSFADFAAGWLRDDPPECARVGRQSRFLSAPEGAGGVDHLFRFDRMDDVLDFLGARIGARPAIERRNVSPATPEAEPSDPIRNHLRDRAPEEFRLWDALCETRR